MSMLRRRMALNYIFAHPQNNYPSLFYENHSAMMSGKILLIDEVELSKCL